MLSQRFLPEFHAHRIVIGIFEALVQRSDCLQSDIRRKYETVNDVILRVFCVGRIVRLIVQTARRRRCIVGKREAVRYCRLIEHVSQPMQG